MLNAIPITTETGQIVMDSMRASGQVTADQSTNWVKEYYGWFYIFDTDFNQGRIVSPEKLVDNYTSIGDLNPASYTEVIRKNAKPRPTASPYTTLIIGSPTAGTKIAVDLMYELGYNTDWDENKVILVNNSTSNRKIDGLRIDRLIVLRDAWKCPFMIETICNAMDHYCQTTGKILPTPKGWLTKDE